MKKVKKVSNTIYENSQGIFSLVQGKLYDSENNKVSAKDVSTNRDPLLRITI